jgi:bifunctional non-homologous end joining protein LigD
VPARRDAPSLLAQLRQAERSGGDGALRFQDGRTLPVTHLDRPVWRDLGITKGDLLAHYLELADVVVPAIAGRALVLTRHPAGVGGPAFHQHDPGGDAPDAVDVATLPTADGTPARRLIGSLGSLLHAVQLGAVGVDAWHSRVDAPDVPDYAVLDLDPSPDAPQVGTRPARRPDARAARAPRLRRRPQDLGLPRTPPDGAPRPGTSYDGAAALAQEVATAVADAHPTLATVERAIDDRPPRTVYLDHLQNARGKTLAAAFCARAKADAAISAPLAWDALSSTAPPERIPITAVKRRLRAIERLWQAAWTHAAPDGAWRPR